jgi:hypothetical protein
MPFFKIIFKSLIVRGHQFWETERFYLTFPNLFQKTGEWSAI